MPGSRKGRIARRRPRVFTSEVFAAIPAWVEMGARPEHIAAALGVSVTNLRVRCSRARISLAARRPALSGGLPPPVWAALQRAADRRGCTIPRLISDVLVGVAQRGLFSEVLDGDPQSDRSGPRQGRA